MHGCDRPDRRRGEPARAPGRLRGRHGVRPERDLPDRRRLQRRGPVAQRLHRQADLLPVGARATRGLPHHPRLPVALGHRLVLVLTAVRYAAAADPPDVAAPLPALRRLPGAGRLRPPARAVRHAQRPPRPGAARSGDPGRGDPRGARGRLPALLHGRGRHEPGVAVPGATAQRPPLAAVPAAAGRGVCELRLLGDGAAATGPFRRLPQPPRRGGGDRPGRLQGAVFDVVLPGGRVLGHLQRPGLCPAQERLRRRRTAGRAVREVRARKITRHAAGREGMAAMALAQVFERIAGPDAPVEFHAYDGSEAGVAGAPVRITVRSPVALSYMAQAPGSLGLARAYVSGHLDVDGDMYTALARMSQIQQVSLTPAERLRLLGDLGGPKLLYPRVPPPPQEVRVRRRWLGGQRHSKGRDASAIAHHYDVSNTFYEWVLGPSMAYTCACYPDEDASLEQAQAYKHELVARKLALQPGMRLLDVGCGWGGMVRHAAREHGVKALGVTLSAQQAAWAQQAIVREGLSGLAEVRHLDYRDVPEAEFDAVSSIGLTEHIGKAQLPGYFSFLFGKLKPGGRLLNHCITRPDNAEPARRAGGFINRYVFPDGELEGPGHLVSVMNGAGFEIRHEENLREHYSRTLAAWCANLDAHWDEAVAEVGQGTARVWRLYMAGSRLGFDRNVVELHQILGVRLEADGRSHMPLRPDWESVPAPVAG